MGILPRLRRQRLWLALASLAFCLPWLVMVGGGRCALRVDASTAATAAPQARAVSEGCTRCCPPTTPRPAQAVFCCEAFKAGLPLDVGLSKLTPPTVQGHTPDGAVFFDLLVSKFVGVHRADPSLGPGPSGPMPPGAFLRTVARRCFPSNAPPVSAALLS